MAEGEVEEVGYFREVLQSAGGVEWHFGETERSIVGDYACLWRETMAVVISYWKGMSRN